MKNLVNLLFLLCPAMHAMETEQFLKTYAPHGIRAITRFDGLHSNSITYHAKFIDNNELTCTFDSLRLHVTAILTLPPYDDQAEPIQVTLEPRWYYTLKTLYLCRALAKQESDRTNFLLLREIQGIARQSVVINTVTRPVERKNINSTDSAAETVKIAQLDFGKEEALVNSLLTKLRENWQFIGTLNRLES